MQKRRKYVYIGVTGCFIALFIVICICLHKKSIISTKKLFGIEEKEYVVVEKNNTLSAFKYGGIYYLKIQITEKQMDEFISNIDNNRYTYIITKEDFEEYKNTLGKSDWQIKYDEENLEKYRKLIEEISGKDIEEIDRMYRYEGMSKRFVFDIRYFGQYAPAEGWVIISDCRDGKYEVDLYFQEK